MLEIDQSPVGEHIFTQPGYVQPSQPGLLIEPPYLDFRGIDEFAPFTYAPPNVPNLSAGDWFDYPRTNLRDDLAISSDVKRTTSELINTATSVSLITSERLSEAGKRYATSINDASCLTNPAKQ